MPASSTSISSPQRSKVQFIPNSPMPPRGMISRTLATIYVLSGRAHEYNTPEGGTGVPPVLRSFVFVRVISWIVPGFGKTDSRINTKQTLEARLTRSVAENGLTLVDLKQ